MALDLRLYALLDPEHAGGRELAEIAQLVAQGGATLVQLRDKHRPTRVVIEDARAIKATLAVSGVPLVINDRVDVALACKADGVHVGQDDMPVEDARRLLGPSAIVGLSVKNVEQAQAASLDILDYVGIGGVFATTSKTNADPPIGIGGLGHIAATIRRRSPKFPVCAIAGIDASNAAAAIAAGADGVAVISALSRKPDPLVAARELRAIVDASSGAAAAIMTAIALTIAGSDSCGGAGIQADLKTFSALGVYGASVITAVTAQNTKGIRAIHAVPAEFVAAQIDAVFEDLAIAATKIGMLWGSEIIAAVAAGLARWRHTQVVLDPVLIASSGDPLIADEARESLKCMLIPRARLITPNLPEAAALLDLPIARNEEEMREQGERLLALGPQAVLVKGGHGAGPASVDILIEPAGFTRFAAERVGSRSRHGTGCTLSSAIAAGLAKGLGLAEAVEDAKRYLTASLKQAAEINIGSGNGPVHAVW